MSFIVTVVCTFLAFLLGRTSAKIENQIVFRDQLIIIIDAIIKVDQLLSFKGQSIKDLKIVEVVNKVTEQLDLKNKQ
jgi:hypothetical protein